MHMVFSHDDSFLVTLAHCSGKTEVWSATSGMLLCAIMIVL